MSDHTIPPTHILHADDDDDDRYLFKKALEELEFPYTFTSVRNGQELLQLLHTADYQLPDVLFLDLNMPKINGFECLSEIKKIEKLTQLPVIIFSTAYPYQVVNKLYADGAEYYIKKPVGFRDLIDKISLALSLIKERKPSRPTIEEFVL